MRPKTVLAILSEHGYWGVELVGPMERLEAAGHRLAFATPRGRRPVALAPSYDPSFKDAPLGVHVTTAEDAAKVKALEASDRLAAPRSLADWFPERPYFSVDPFLRAFERYHARLKKAQAELAEYDALLLVGGSGPILDVVNNQRVHDVILGFHAAGKPIAAICYGVAALVFARDLEDRRSILAGKHVTGHCVEFDYKDGTRFASSDFDMGPPPYTLEYMLRDAVGEGGRFHGNFGKETSVVLDYPFLTARSLQCSYEFGDQLVRVLDDGLRRYGW